MKIVSRRDDDNEDLIPWAEDLPPLVEPAEYDARCLQVKTHTHYRQVKVNFLFEILTEGHAFGVYLRGYCPLTTPLSPHSKLAGWFRVIAQYTGYRPSKIPLKAFRDYWFRVRVTTVLTDHRQQPLAPCNQYSRVEDIVSIVGPLKKDV